LASPIKISHSYFPARQVAAAKPRSFAFTQDQIAAFYLELRSPLFASLRRWNLPDEEVEDLVQETFVRLLSYGPEDLKTENVRYWLFRVAHNLAIDRHRSGWRYLLDSQAEFDTFLSAHPSPNFDPEKVYLASEKLQIVQDNLAKLTPRQRHAIHLRISGLSYKAIAYRLKGTTSSVAELIRRGLKRLGEEGASFKAQGTLQM
jgi:RNA polymerase sigma-70 factor (ECF subfamily)